MRVFKRDDYRCQLCKKTSQELKNIKLSAHHKKSFKDHPRERFKVSNGITLCWDCHGKIHGMRKGDRRTCPRQQEVITEIIAAGGRAAVVSNWDELKQLLDGIEPVQKGMEL
jgi:5-methylcytosine-specific restriction endonuclease McrA